MLFGADYYPEHWPKERWKTDARLMREANINVVRMAEFSWALLEPCEGSYDFSWLDEIIEILSSEGIQTVLGTPTAAPPIWLSEHYPRTLMRDRNGQARGFGSRRHYCYNSPNYQELTRNIVRKMTQHYQNHPHIIAWQIDNEFGCHDTTRCYCSNCRYAFQQWLKAKYQTLSELNREWGTVFWSQTYDAWQQIPLPAHGTCHDSDDFLHGYNPGLLLDFYRFSSDSVVGYQRLQADEIRMFSKVPVTHNCMGNFNDIDYFKLGRDLDFISWDNYPTMQWKTSSYKEVAMTHDLMRGIKNKSFWVMEQQSGPCGWSTMGSTPRPGQLRLWTYQAAAHGAEAIVYFRWRSCTVGTEQYWHGILDHDGIPRRRYTEIKKTGAELKELDRLMAGSEVISEAALIHSYDNHWSHSFQRHALSFDYEKLIASYHGALLSRNLSCDIIGIHHDLSSYKLVIMPAFNLMNEAAKEKTEAYVRDGGTLLVTFRSGTKTWNNAMTTQTLPGYFKALAGIEVYEFDGVPDGRKTEVTATFGKVQAGIWCEILKPVTATAIGTYDSEYYRGEAAITVNTFGKGKVYYVGCGLFDEGIEALMAQVAENTGIKPLLPECIDGVEVTKRATGSGIFYTVLNHNACEIKISIPGDYTELINRVELNGALRLAPYDIAVLKERGA